MRSLYCCFNARVQDTTVYCAKGHLLPVHIRQVQRGKRLEFTICQQCQDYEEMGPPIQASERGWSKI